MPDRFAPSPSSLGIMRNAVIAGSVVLLHVAVLWILQSGFLHRATEIVTQVAVLSEFIEPPKPRELPPAPPPPTSESKRQITKTPVLPRSQVIRESTPAPDVPTSSLEQPLLPAPMLVPAHSEPPASSPALKAPSSVELPSSNADYLQNPKPVYPAMSKRFGEQGKAIVRVLIDVDGLPKQASIRQSSGYERLDEAAYQAVMSWRYVPGTRNGVVEPMEFDVPINWVLN